MVLPVEILIKQEKEDYEIDSGNHLIPEFEVSVKVEKQSTPVTPYEVKTEFMSDEEPASFALHYGNSDEIYEGFDYEELIEYSRVQCAICNEQFFERYSLLQHNLVHLKLQIEPLRQCSLCPKHFTTENELGTHMKAIHNNNEVLNKEYLDFKVTKMLHQCKICGTIQTYKTIHSHMREVHSTDSYKCGICTAVFKCSRYLRRHIFKVHMNRNTNDEKCSLCPAVLKGKNALRTHMRNCHSEKAQCQICKSVLKSQSYLNTHMRRVHYEDGKEHKCFCGKKFPSPRYLKVHKKNAHSR